MPSSSQFSQANTPIDFRQNKQRFIGLFITVLLGQNFRFIHIRMNRPVKMNLVELNSLEASINIIPCNAFQALLDVEYVF